MNCLRANTQLALRPHSSLALLVKRQHRLVDLPEVPRKHLAIRTRRRSLSGGESYRLVPEAQHMTRLCNSGILVEQDHSTPPNSEQDHGTEESTRPDPSISPEFEHDEEIKTIQCHEAGGHGTCHWYIFLEHALLRYIGRANELAQVGMDRVGFDASISTDAHVAVGPPSSRFAVIRCRSDWLADRYR